MKYMKKLKPIQCRYWFRHYDSDEEVEYDINKVILDLQNHGYSIVDVVIDYVKFNIETTQYKYSITILYK